MKALPQRLAGNYGDMTTEIPLIILLAEYRGTPDSLERIGERHGLGKRPAMSGCRRVIEQLGIKRPSSPRWHAGPRPEQAERQRKPFAWVEQELAQEVRHWAAYERTQTGAALMAATLGLTVPGGAYRLNHEAGKDRSRRAAKARHAKLGKTAEWKIKAAVRNAVARIAKATGKPRTPRQRTQEFLGCTYAEARAYLTPLLLPGMTWENHGAEWEIDHKRPLASFDLLNEDQRRAACHYTNLQPLTIKENRRKSDRWDGDQGRMG